MSYVPTGYALPTGLPAAPAPVPAAPAPVPVATAAGKWNVTANLKSGGTLTLASGKDEKSARSMFAYAKTTGKYSVIALYNGTTLVERYPASSQAPGTDWGGLATTALSTVSSIFGKQPAALPEGYAAPQAGRNYMPYLLIGGAALAAVLLLRRKK